MRNFFLFLLVILFLWIRTATSQPLQAETAITAEEYCEFLNAVATNDVENFYEEIGGRLNGIGSSNQIIRFGKPGNYCYKVASSKPSVPMLLMSKLAAEQYCNWLEEAVPSSIFPAADKQLKSNQLTFQLVNTNAVAYQAGGAEAGVINSFLDELIETVVLLSMGETMIASHPERSLDVSHEYADLHLAEACGTETTATSSSESSHAAVLNHLRRIVEANPAAARFIVIDEGDITSMRPQEEIPNASGRNRSENKKTIDALKALIPSGVADDLLRYHTGTIGMHVDSLSAQRLRAILDCYDEHARRESANRQPQASDCFMPLPPRLQTGREVKFKGRDPKYQRLKAEDQDILLSQKSILTELEIDSSSLWMPAESSEIIEFQKALCQIVSRDQSDLALSYRTADSVWEQAEEAWSHRIDAFQTKEAREKAHEQASQFLEKVKEATTAEGLQQNLLGSIVTNANKLSNFLGKLPAEKAKELSSLIATASATIDKVNKIGGKIVKTLASLNENITGYLEKAAATTFEDAKNKAPLLENEAQQQEEAAQRAETTATLELAKSLMLPAEGSDETLWGQWTSRISAKSKSDNISWITTIVSQGMRGSASIATAVAAAWAERMEYSKAYVQHLESTNYSKVQCLQELYGKLLEAKKKANTTEANISAAQKKFETIAQRKNRLQAELKEHNQALDELIRKKEFLKTEEVIKNISAAVKQLEESSKDLEEAEKEVTRTLVDEVATREQMSKCAQDYKKAEKTFLREIERAKARLEGDQGEALELIWLEEAQELREQADREATIKAKVKEGIQRIFLSGKISSFKMEQAESKEEMMMPIKPPLHSDDELEAIGRKMLGIEKEEESSIPEDLAAKLYKDVRAEIMAEACREDDENEERWNLREEVDKAAERVATFVKPKILANKELDEASDQQSGIEMVSNVGLKYGRARNNSLDSSRSSSTILSSIQASLSTTISSIGSVLIRLKKTNQRVQFKNTLEQQWEEKATAANEKRIKAGGADIEGALDFWREADRVAVKARVIKDAKENYAANHVCRWLTRIYADEFKKSFLETLQEALSFAADVAGDNYDSREYSGLVDQTNDVKYSAKNASSQWNTTADLFLQATQGGATEVARAKLKEEDRAVIAFLEQVLRDYYRGYESPYQQQERDDKEKQAYEQKLSGLDKIFEQADAAFKEADETAETLLVNDIPSDRGKARELDDEAHQLEERAIQRYEEATKRLALEGARTQVPGATDLWEKQVTEKIQQARNAERIFKNIKRPSGKDRRILDRAISIATANKNAWEVFKEEVERLAPLETIWREFLETEAKASKLKEEHAARSYAQDSTLWEALTNQERSEYEMSIKIRNWIKNNAIQKEINQAAKEAQELREKANQTFFFFRQSAEQAAKNAGVYYNKLKEAEAERQKVIQWTKLTPAEREIQQKAKVEKLRLKADTTIGEAAEYWEMAAEKQETREEGIMNYWKEAAEEAEIAEAAWEKYKFHYFFNMLYIKPIRTGASYMIEFSGLLSTITQYSSDAVELLAKRAQWKENERDAGKNGTKEEVLAWKKAIEKAEEGIRQYRNARREANAWMEVSRNFLYFNDKGYRLNNDASSISRAAYVLAKQAEKKKKERENKINKKNKEVLMWRKVSEEIERVVKLHDNSAAIRRIAFSIQHEVKKIKASMIEWEKKEGVALRDGDFPLAAKYAEAFKRVSVVTDVHYQQAIQVFAEGSYWIQNWEGLFSSAIFNCGAILAMRLSAAMLVQSLELEKSEIDYFATEYSYAAEVYSYAAKKYEEGAQDFLMGGFAYPCRLYWQGNDLSKIGELVITRAEENTKIQKARFVARNALRKAIQASDVEAAQLWNIAIKKGIQVEVTCATAANVYRDKLRASLAPWLEIWCKNEIEDAENEKNYSIFDTVALRCRSNGSFKWIAANSLRYKATELGHIVYGVTRKAVGTPDPQEAITLWEEAFQKACDARELWTQIMESLEQSPPQIPETLKAQWSRLLENLQNEKAFWIAKTAWYEAKKEENLAYAMKNKVLASHNTEDETVANITELWNEAIQQGQKAKATFDQTLEIYKKEKNQSLKQFKNRWIERLNDIKKERDDLVPRLTKWSLKDPLLRTSLKLVNKN